MESHWVLACSSLLLVGAAPPPQSPTASALPGPAPVIAYPANSFEGRILAQHNAERARYGLAPLRWDPALVPGAAQWAATMAQTGIFDHSPKANRPGVAENMAMGARGYFGLDRLVGTWLAERAAFTPGFFPNTSRTGNWLHTSHYTQVIWPATNRIGCAMASGRGNDYLVCRYSPKGNQDGKPVGISRVERG
ncbi:MAG: CAP domain-containing protein [Sphingomicrobium sp.]